MIEVRIGHEWGDPVRLMEVPWDQLDAVIPLIERWGLYADGTIERGQLSGQFVLDDRGAFFEVKIEDEK